MYKNYNNFKKIIKLQNLGTITWSAHASNNSAKAIISVSPNIAVSQKGFIYFITHHFSHNYFQFPNGLSNFLMDSNHVRNYSVCMGIQWQIIFIKFELWKHYLYTLLDHSMQLINLKTGNLLSREHLTIHHSAHGNPFCSKTVSS